jgi:hypothetical protein
MKPFSNIVKSPSLNGNGKVPRPRRIAAQSMFANYLHTVYMPIVCARRFGAYTELTRPAVLRVNCLARNEGTVPDPREPILRCHRREEAWIRNPGERIL